MPNVRRQQNLPRLEVPGRSRRVRDTLRSRQSGRRTAEDRQIRKKHKQPHNPGRLCRLQRRKKPNQRARQTCFQRETHRLEHDSHHPATNVHREVEQAEHIKTRDLSQRPQGRQKGHVRKPSERR